MRQRSTEEQAHPYGSAVGQLIDQFATLPGIGRKSAERLAHHVLASPRDEALRLAEAIQKVKDAVHPCSQCFNLTEGELCAICRDAKRQRHIALHRGAAPRRRCIGGSGCLPRSVSRLAGPDFAVGRGRAGRSDDRPADPARAEYRGHRDCNGYKSDRRRGWNGPVYLEPSGRRTGENHPPRPRESRPAAY